MFVWCVLGGCTVVYTVLFCACLYLKEEASASRDFLAVILIIRMPCTYVSVSSHGRVRSTINNNNNNNNNNNYYYYYYYYYCCCCCCCCCYYYY